MLKCSACRVSIPPFTLQKPTETRACTSCGAELTFTKASRLEVVVDGPLVPPVPAGISVERHAGRASYRENAAGDELVLRWKRPATHGTAWVLGVLAGLLLISVLGGVFLDDVCWLFAFLLLAVTMLALFDAYRSVGEVRVRSDAVRSGHGLFWSKALTVPRSEIRELRVVNSGIDPPSREIWARLSDGTEQPTIRGLPSSEASVYILALLREELRLSG